MRYRALVIAAAALVVLMTAGSFVAFTSQWVSILARVRQPPTVVKHVLKDPDLTGSPVQPPAGCIPAGSDPPLSVPMNTCVWWVLRIAVTNSFPDTIMQDVVVKDLFGAELDGQPLDDLPVNVEVITHSRGESGKEAFETQVRITWCVTGDLVDDACVDGGQLLPGESEYLDMLVWTKLNPAGKQEYTSPGTYEMNSGATAKWLDQNGVQCAPLASCPSTPSIDVIAYAANGTETPSSTPTSSADPPPTQTGTATPTLTPTSTFTPIPTKTFTPTATATSTRRPTRTPVPTRTPTPVPGTPTSTSTPTITPTPTTAARPGIILLNEVLLNGTQPPHRLLQFVELKNTTALPLPLKGWSLSDQDDVWSIDTNTGIAAGGYAVVVLNGKAPQVPSGVPVLMPVQKKKQLDPVSGRLQLVTPLGLVVDGISWGTDRSILNPAVAAPPAEMSLSRVPDGTDTDAAADFLSQSPSPGASNDLTPAADAEALPTATPTPTAAAEPLPTATPVPEEPATPTPTPAPTPEEGSG